MSVLDDYVLVTLTKDEYYAVYRGGILLPDHRGMVRHLAFGDAVIDAVLEDGGRDLIVHRKDLGRLRRVNHG